MTEIEAIRQDIAALAALLAQLNERLARLEPAPPSGVPERTVEVPEHDDEGPSQPPITAATQELLDLSGCSLADTLGAQPPSLHVMANDSKRYEPESWLDANLDRKITRVTFPCPKRRGFKSAPRYEHLHREGQTMREYIERHAQEARRLGLDANRAIAQARGDLRWDHKHDFFTLGG